MEMVTDDKRDMRKLLQELSTSWLAICKRLLKTDFSVPKQQQRPITTTLKTQKSPSPVPADESKPRLTVTNKLVSIQQPEFNVAINIPLAVYSKANVKSTSRPSTPTRTFVAKKDHLKPNDVGIRESRVSKGSRKSEAMKE
jgi:hypothetical protein